MDENPYKAPQTEGESPLATEATDERRTPASISASTWRVCMWLAMICAAVCLCFSLDASQRSDRATYSFLGMVVSLLAWGYFRAKVRKER